MNDGSAIAHPDLDRLGKLTDCETLAADIAEPLAESAIEGFRMAMTLCDPGDGCRAYHGLWQYLRIAGFVRALSIDGPLFVDAAEKLARAGRLRHVLISGSADYSMLAHLAHGARRAGRRVVFDIVDRCATTLRVNAWYATRYGLDVRTFRSDVYSFQPEMEYDLICTHSFLPYHPVPQRPVLFRLWGGWLAAGGRLCFSNRISPEAIPFDAAERRQRMDRAAAKALSGLKERAIPLPCPPDEFVALVQAFGAHRQGDHPAIPLDSVERWIADAGLSLEIAVAVTDVLPGVEDSTLRTGEVEGRPRMWFQARRL